MDEYNRVGTSDCWLSSLIGKLSKANQDKN